MVRPVNRTSERIGAVVVIIAAMVALGALLAACSSTVPRSLDAQPVPTPSQTMSPLAAGALQDPQERDAVTVNAPPVNIRIPKIGVASALEQLGVDATGRLNPPSDFDLAGWYAGGVVPGDIGPAIIAGHIDSPSAPAVFARLGELRAGDEVVITTSSGDDLSFRVTGTTESAKSAFPTDAVYSNVPAPELRLITCAATFDSSIGHYTDNLVVFAVLER